MASRCRRGGLGARRRLVSRCLGSIAAAIALLSLCSGAASASDCPPGSITDCAYATSLAVNPLVPIGGTVVGVVVAVQLSIALTVGMPAIDLRATRASRPSDSRPPSSDPRSSASQPRRVDVGPSWVIDTFTMPLVRVVENPIGRENRTAHPNLAGASSVVASVILAIPIGLTALWGEGEIEVRHALHALFGMDTERGGE